MKKKLLKFSFVIFFLVIAVSPIFTFADFQGPCLPGTHNDGTACVPNSDIVDFILQIQDILDSLIPLLVLLGVVYFVWGVVRYVIGDSEEAKKKGKDGMIYGIIGLAVIVALWGLVFVIVDTFDLDTTAPALPIAPTGETVTIIPKVSNIADLMSQIRNILNSITPILVLLGMVYFIWSVVRYVIADSEEAKKTGKDRMIYGIIGFAIIISLWGLVNVLVKTFNLNSTAPTISTITGPGSCNLANNPRFQDLLCYIIGIINDSAIPLVFALAIVIFVWGVVQFFIINAEDEKKRTQGKQFMIWGVVALAVMLSIWGLVGILSGTFSIAHSVLPQVHPPGS